MKYIGGGILLCVFTLIMVTLFNRLIINQPVNMQPQGSSTQPMDIQPDAASTQESYPAPADGKSVESTYPAPVKLTPILSPTPAFTPTEIDPYSLPEWQPDPITPRPTATLRPGPSPTPIPLRVPAKDASGNIFFAAKTGEEDTVNFYTMNIDTDGKLVESSIRQTEGQTRSDADFFPSPDGSRMAVLRPWGLLTIYNTRKGAIEKEQFSIGDGGNFFNWYPDNQNILYEGVALENVISEETMNVTGPVSGSVTGAAASPDGQYIVYGYDNNQYYEPGLWMVNTNGQNERYFAKTDIPFSISWSPDGKSIFFIGGWKYIIDADGSNLREVAANISSPLCPPTLPLWSPDGRSIAMVVYKGASSCWGWSHTLFEDTNIVIIDVESGEAQPLLKDGSLGNIDPAWSPDGSQLVFVSTRSGSPEIWAVNRDGSNLRQLTQNDLVERFPFWYTAAQ